MFCSLKERVYLALGSRSQEDYEAFIAKCSYAVTAEKRGEESTSKVKLGASSSDPAESVTNRTTGSYHT